MAQQLEKISFGLTKEYYLRQMFFSVLIGGFLIYTMAASGNPNKVINIIFFSIFTLLYPYSRFVYESVVGFILGDNVVFGNAILVFAVKAFTMIVCWMGALFIAPVGLIWLYLRNRASQ